MSKTKYFAAAVGTLMLLGAALPASASSLTTTQINAIISLLQSFGADPSVIANVSRVFGITGDPVASSCLNLSRNLTLGATGSDVTQLQNYLINKGYLNNVATGYYGYMTVQAVGKLQVSLGIVSDSNDPAYGLVGPLTRGKVGCGGNPQPQLNQASATIDQSSLTTSSGVPTITGAASGVSSVYVAITSGTNQAGTANQAGNGQVSVVNGQWNATIYPKAENVFTAGVYSVSVYTAIGGTLLTSGTLSILGNALQPTATIDQSSLTADTGGKSAATIMITGTASNTDRVGVGIKGQPTVFAMVSTTGTWRAFVPSVYPSTYTVQILNEDTGGSKEEILATGMLTVTGGSSVSLSANPTSGAAPLTVTFLASNLSSSYFYRMDFGDGQVTGQFGLNPQILTHTYNSAGTYSAQVQQAPNACAGSSTTCTQPVPTNWTTVAPQNIVVSGTNLQPSATITSPSTQSSANFAVTGSAQNSSSVIVTLVSTDSSGNTYGGGTDWNTIGGYLQGTSAATTPAGNHLYSYTVAVYGAHIFAAYFSGIPVGDYTVLIHNNDYAQYALAGQGTLTVSAKGY